MYNLGLLEINEWEPWSRVVCGRQFPLTLRRGLRGDFRSALYWWQVKWQHRA